MKIRRLVKAAAVFQIARYALNRRRRYAPGRHPPCTWNATLRPRSRFPSATRWSDRRLIDLSRTSRVLNRHPVAGALADGVRAHRHGECLGGGTDMAEPGAPVVEHKPYVPDEARGPEFTPKAIAVGALFGLIFGAS